MGIEIEFFKEKEDLPGYGPVAYEWACQEVFGVFRLVFHFFLGKGKEDPKFKAALQAAGEAAVTPNVIPETFYTEDFDGHDLLLTGVRPHARTAIKAGVIRNLRLELEKK